MLDYIKELYLLESEASRLPLWEETEYPSAVLELDCCHIQIQKAMGKEFF